MNTFLAVYRWLIGLEQTVEEIMHPLTRIHDALEVRRQKALDAAALAEARGKQLLDEAMSHDMVAAKAVQAKAKLASLLS